MSFEVRRGTVVSFSASDWTALVLLDGADLEAQMPVGQWIPSSMMAADAEVAVLVFGGTNTDDGVVLGPYGAVSLWNFPAIGAAANGALLIGNGSGMVLATITGTANRVTVTNGAGTITLSGPQDLATGSSPTFATITAGEIDLVTSGGGSGNVKAATALYAGGQSNASLYMKDLGSINNAGTAAVAAAAGDIALIFVLNTSDGTFAIYTLQGGVHATQEISDPSGKFTTVAGTATSVNIYWSGSQYELQNNLGSAKTFRVFEFRNG